MLGSPINHCFILAALPKLESFMQTNNPPKTQKKTLYIAEHVSDR